MGHRTYSKHTACEMSIQWAFSSGLLSCQAFAVTDFGTSQDLFTSANKKFSFCEPAEARGLGNHELASNLSYESPEFNLIYSTVS